MNQRSSPLRYAAAHLIGLPHLLAASTPGLVFGISGMVTGLVLASLACFVIYLPILALLLNGGAPLPETAPAPRLTRSTWALLLVVWTATAWAGAAYAGST